MQVMDFNDYKARFFENHNRLCTAMCSSIMSDIDFHTMMSHTKKFRDKYTGKEYIYLEMQEADDEKWGIDLEFHEIKEPQAHMAEPGTFICMFDLQDQKMVRINESVLYSRFEAI